MARLAAFCRAGMLGKVYAAFSRSNCPAFLNL